MLRRTRILLTATGAVVLVALVGARLLQSPGRPAPPPITVPLASSNTPLFVSPGMAGAFLVLPDGTLWRWGLPGGHRARAETPVRVGTQSNWVMAVGGNNGTLAITREGELWESGWNGGTGPVSSHLTRIGSDSDWMSAAKSDTAAAALKRDGSLWTWGQSTHGCLGDPGVLNRPAPARLGSNVWLSLALDGSNYGFLGLSSEGRLQAWGKFHQPGATFAAPTPIHPGTHWVAVSGHLFLDRAGVLWTGPANLFQPINAPDNIRPVLTNTAPGRFALAGPNLFELRPDGTLWRHPRPFLRAPYARTAGKAGQVGSRSDWVRLWHGGGGAVGLTADGTLWAWGTDFGSEPIPTLESRIRILATDAINRIGRLVGIPRVSRGTTSAQPRRIEEPRPILRMVPAPASPP